MDWSSIAEPTMRVFPSLHPSHSTLSPPARSLLSRSGAGPRCLGIADDGLFAPLLVKYDDMPDASEPSIRPAKFPPDYSVAPDPGVRMEWSFVEEQLRAAKN